MAHVEQYLDEWLCRVWLVDSNVFSPLLLNGQSSLPHHQWMLGLLQLSQLVTAQLERNNASQLNTSCIASNIVLNCSRAA